MAIVISGNGIDMGGNPVSNASKIDSTVINENGENVATTSNLTGFKNYIINGNFDIWQRGASQTSAGYGSDDRWNNEHYISTKTHSQVSCTDTERELFNASYFSRTVTTYVSGTNSYVKKIQSIENITRLAGKTVTISFWAKADSNKKMNVQVVDVYGSGGTPTASYASSIVNFGNVDLTPTWTKYKLTATLPSLVGKTLGTDGVHTSFFRLDFGFTFGSDRHEVTLFGMPVGQSGTFDIAQVQLEEGTIATPFEQRPIGLELSLCQRYYQKTFAYDVVPTNGASVDNIADSFNGIVSICPHRFSSNGIIKTSILFPVEMRINPTIQKYGNSEGYWKIVSPDINEFTTNISLHASTKGLAIANERTTTHAPIAFGHYTADAEL